MATPMAESQTLLSSAHGTPAYTTESNEVELAHRAGSRSVMAVGLFALAATAGMVASGGVRSVAKSTLASSASRAHVAGGHAKYSGMESITAHNEYTRQRGFAGAGYAHLAKGMVVEPHRVTTLQFVLPEGQSIDEDTQPAWNAQWIPNSNPQSTLDMLSTDVQLAEDGTTLVTATTVFSDLGLHLATLTVYLDDGSSYQVSRALYSHYVRRNLKQLSSTEKEEFFEAFKAMYHYNTTEGQRIYGGHFRGLRDFVGAHLSAAGERNADRFHDGMGFLTQHAALTNEFEMSMQSMYPKMAMPYWDYTEDGEIVHAAKNLDVAWEQEIWGKDWFGNATGESHHVEEGRFAYQEAYKSSKEGVVTNAYGYMRSPWNVGKSHYVTRVHKFCDVSFSYQSWPFCADHYNLTFKEDTNTWYDWVWAGGYVPHGPIHYYIGGYSQCGPLLSEFEKIGLSEAQVKDFAVWMVMLPKNFWRSYVTEAPKSCSADTPQTECHMTCLLNYENKDDVKKFMEMTYSFIGDLGYSRAVSSADWLVSLTEEQSAAIMKIFCETPFSPGEQIESASPIDVSFWPIHPTMERLFQYKRMAQDFTDTSWGATDDESTSYCTEGAAEEFAENYMLHGFNDDRMGTLCKGHHADDMTMFWSNVKDTTTGEYVYRATTNRELFQMINPAEYMASYIYENFEWKHCEGRYDFPSVEWGNVTTYSDINTDDAHHYGSG